MPFLIKHYTVNLAHNNPSKCQKLPMQQHRANKNQIIII